MGPSEVCDLKGFTEEETDALKSKSQSSSSRDSSKSKMPYMDQILHKLPLQQELDSVLEESNESEESEFIFAESLERSHKELDCDYKDDMFSLGGLRSLQAISEEFKVSTETPQLSLYLTHNSDQFSKQTDTSTSLLAHQLGISSSSSESKQKI